MYDTLVVTNLNDVPGLSDEERRELEHVTKRFRFRSNEYYLSLMDPSDPSDPIRRIIVPNSDELTNWGRPDPCSEGDYTVVRGLQHKYRDTVLFLVTQTCGGFCRFCFRKRIFDPGNEEAVPKTKEALEYIREHEEIRNVLVSGGDPLTLPTGKLEPIIRELRSIEHLKIIRIGSKMLAYNPYRILNDPSLGEMVSKYSLPDRRLYFMAHFNHPRELTKVSIEAINMLIDSGAVVCNQTPILRGVNDDPSVLGDLFSRLASVGAAPYYLFLVRPTIGNKPFAVPIERAYDIFHNACVNLSGLAKQARLVMSHSTGKVEIVAKMDDTVVFRYHRAAEHRRIGEVFTVASNPDAYWLDDYNEITASYPLEEVFCCSADD